MNKVFAIIVAAGEGKRFGSLKTFAALKGKPLLDYSLEIFNRHSAISGLVLVLREVEDEELFRTKYDKLKAVARGGSRRQDSVSSGFKKINAEQKDIVLIHDAARPLVKSALIDAVIDKARSEGAAIPVLPLEDTIKKIDRGKVSHTVERQGLYRVQTPQGFSYDILKRALEWGEQNTATDESTLVENLGYDVSVVPGDPHNLKITFPEDLKIAEALIDG